MSVGWLLCAAFIIIIKNPFYKESYLIIGSLVVKCCYCSEGHGKRRRQTQVSVRERRAYAIVYGTGSGADAVNCYISISNEIESPTKPVTVATQLCNKIIHRREAMHKVLNLKAVIMDLVLSLNVTCKNARLTLLIINALLTW